MGFIGRDGFESLLLKSAGTGGFEPPTSALSTKKPDSEEQSSTCKL